jgi:site-specific DNA recombinase
VAVTRAGVYTRVSRDVRQGRSVAEQLAECEAEAARRGWRVVLRFEDNDRSASRYASKTRPAFDDLKGAIEARKIDVLVTWEASRATRDLSVYVALRDLCRKHGVRWSYSGSVMDLDNADDSFKANLDAVLAEREIEQTRARTMRSVRANAAAGRPHGKLTWGYVRTYDPTTRALVSQDIDPAVGAVIHEMGERLLAGESCNSIAADLNARGIPTPRGGRGWTLGQVGRTLRTPTYAGLRTLHGEIVGKGIWAPIFDEVTWRRIQEVLADPRRRNRREGATRHLLTGIALCGVCDSRLQIRRNRSMRAYTCVQGFHVSMREEHLDKIITDLVLGYLGKADSRIALAAAADDGEARAAMDAAQRERARLDEFIEKAATGALSASALAKIESRILASVKVLESQAHAHVPSAALDLLGDEARERFEDMPVDVQRSIIRALMTPRLRPGVRGQRGLHPERILPGWRAQGSVG